MWYIASQGPLENTVQDFWQLVWEQEALVIAMLTDLKVSAMWMSSIRNVFN